MTFIEMAAAAGESGTWAGVAVAFIVGVGGLIVGIVGLVKAHQAKQEAKEANRIATAANAISVAANSLSEEANQISRQSAMRSAEEHDVDWDCNWLEPGTYVVSNSGRDTATKVRVLVTVDDETVTAEAAEVGHLGEIVLMFPRALTAWREEEAERLAFAQHARTGPRLTAPVMNLSPLFGNDHQIRDRILWTTELGTPRLHDESANLQSLEP